VKWRSSWNDKFYQIYVNGEFAGATVDSEQKQMVVQVPTYPDAPVRIEVFAVAASDVYKNFSDELDSLSYLSGRIRISFLRSQDLPAESTVRVYFDKGTGEIDYEHTIEKWPIRIWPAWQDKAGFGISGFGVVDFGFDSAAAVGFGKGSFGQGRFGLDADTLEWVSEPMSAGVYKFAVKVFNKVGSQSGSSEAGEVTVTPAARPAERLSISSFDKQTNQLVLNVS
jgi:hypothetical protein